MWREAQQTPDLPPVRARVARTKTTVPELPGDFVSRPALRELVDHSVRLPATLVSAPAGYGKTLLLADWARQGGHRASIAWVSVDNDDNDPVRFFSAVLAALGQVPGWPGGDALAETLAFDEPAFLAGLVDTLDSLPGNVVLVVDDVHELTTPAVLHGLVRLLRQQPASVRLVFSGRIDPPLHLARLRMQGDLAEIRRDRLRFTAAEAEELLRGCGVELSASQVGSLVAGTEGWPAGLRLAALSLRDQRDSTAVEQFFDDLLGAGRSVADYLAGEVLDRLPADVLRFLRAISICERLPMSLATRLTGREDTGAVLRQLEQETSLVSWTGEDYRVHRLLRAYLRADLVREPPQLASGLHLTAADWFEHQHELVRALDHLHRSEDAGETSAFLVRHAIELLLAGHHDTVAAALKRIGAAGVAQDPRLALTSALANLMTGRVVAADLDLEHVPPTPGESEPELALGRELLESQRALIVGEDPPAPVRPAWDVGSVTENPVYEGWLHCTTGWSLLMTGEPASAYPELARASEVATRLGFDYLRMQSVVGLATLHAFDGDYRTMGCRASEAVALAAANRWTASPWLSAAHAMLAYQAFLCLRPDDARRAADAADTTAGGAGPTPATGILLLGVRAGLRADDGDPHGGLLALRDARRQLTFSGPPTLTALIAQLEQQMALRAGQGHGLGREVLVWAQPLLGGTADLMLMQARGQLALGIRVEVVRGKLAALLDGSLPVVLPTTPIEAELVQTALALRSDARASARAALERALRRARPGEVVRPFALAEPGIRELLVQQFGSFGELNPFAELVLARLSAGRDVGTAGVLSLTEREHTVLLRLPSQRSLDEIAGDLTVSPNTVKTHVRAIYAKLRVNSRRQAVTTARDRGII